MRRLPASVPLALEYPDVGHAESGVAQGVTHWVDGAVDVAQVIEKVPHALRHPLLVAVGLVAAAGPVVTPGGRRERFQQY